MSATSLLIKSSASILQSVEHDENSVARWQQSWDIFYLA